MTSPAVPGTNQTFAALSRLGPTQKIGLGAAVLTLVVGGYLLTRPADDTAMAAMYTELEPRDAAAITDELISQNVEYELADGGRTVLVPADRVYDLRVGLSADGLPNSSEGWALLDRQGITTSDFRQRVDYQRALEGELARTLRSIDGIESATVHLALPEESVFVDEPSEPTASVLVRRSGLTAITADQVTSMVHLVASSVKGMDPENVTIADAAGAVLSTGGVETAAAGQGSRTAATAQVEQEVATSLRNMLARVVGPDSVAVTVRADLDLTARQATTESYDSSNDTGVVVSERVATETYSGSDQEAGTGVLGPDGAPVAAPEPGASESTYEKDDTERTYAVNRTVASTTEAPGAVERLSVAVLVDETTVTEEQAAAIEEMVGTAAGVDLERGDQVVVTRLPFEEVEEADAAADLEVEEAAALAAAERSSMIRTGLIAGMVLIALLLAYRSTRRARREVVTPIDIGAIRAAPLDDHAPPAAALGPTTGDAEPADRASRDALDELSVLADRRPEHVAQILQGWLREEAGSR